MISVLLYYLRKLFNSNMRNILMFVSRSFQFLSFAFGRNPSLILCVCDETIIKVLLYFLIVYLMVFTEKGLLSCWTELVSGLKISWRSTCGSLGFHWSNCMFLCKLYTFLCQHYQLFTQICKFSNLILIF